MQRTALRSHEDWSCLVSASDVTSTIWLVEFYRISMRRVFRLETKMPWLQTPSWRNKAIVFTTVMISAYQDQLNARFSKVYEICKVCGIDSFKYVQEFYTKVCYCQDISCPKHDVAQNETWLVALPVSHMASWAVLGHSKRPRFPDLLPSFLRSGYARLGLARLP